jgi:hypothetical protein
MASEYMDNTKNDQYHLGKIKADIAFIVAQGGRAGAKGSFCALLGTGNHFGIF